MERAEHANSNQNLDIQTLREEHRRLDTLIKELDSQVWLTPEEQVQRKKYQKLKLSTKDRIHRLTQGQD